MKKIMFNDKYGLTKAVLRGEKTQTRRLVKKGYEKYQIWQPSLQQEYGIYGYKESVGWEYIPPQYEVGEIVAIAQRYNSLIFEINTQQELNTRGFRNKMFVKSELMPHRIQITNIRIERLQDISDEDCMREGIMEGEFISTWDTYYYDVIGDVADHIIFRAAKEVFAELIDRIRGKGTWEKNPLVFVYDFKLINL